MLIQTFSNATFIHVAHVYLLRYLLGQLSNLASQLNPAARGD